MKYSSTTDGHPRRRQILAVLCLSLLIVVIDSTILNTALPTLARNLHATTSDLQWITDAYTLVFAALLIVNGALGDRYGRRGALMLGMSIFAAGSVIAALSTGTTTLIASRALMGFGASFVMPATLSILNAVFPPKERAAAIGAWSAISGIGIVVGPSLGGLLLNHFYWGSVFWVNLPLVAIALVAIITVIPSMPGQRAEGSRLDLIGAALSSASLLTIIDAVIKGPNRGWLSGATLIEFAIGAALLTAFVVRELRTEHPLIDVRVFRFPAFSAASFAIAAMFFGLFGSLFVLTQYLQLVHGYSPLSAGLRALPFALGVMVMAPISAVLASKIGARKVVPTGLTLMGAGMLFLTQATPTSSYLFLAVGVLVMGIGMGLTMAPASESILSVLPADKAGVGSAMNDTVQDFGASLGVAVIGSIVSASYRHGIDVSALPASITGSARSSIAAGDATAGQAGSLSPQVLQVAHESFTHAMNTGFLVGGIAALVGAFVVAVALPSLDKKAEVATVSHDLVAA